MKYRFASLVLAATAAVAVPLAAEAQFGLPKLPGSGSAPAVDLTGTQGQLVTQYIDANHSVLIANAHMALALGMKDKAAELNATADAATSGATTDTLKNNDSVASDSTQAIAEQMKNNPTLDAKGKAEYTKGLSSLAIGVIKYVGMRNAATDFGKSLTSASPLMLPKLMTGAYIVKTLPTNIVTLSQSLNNAISFAKSHDIKVPSDATDALSKI